MLKVGRKKGKYSRKSRELKGCKKKGGKKESVEGRGKEEICRKKGEKERCIK